VDAEGSDQRVDGLPGVASVDQPADLVVVEPMLDLSHRRA
jgi:hypothetical protein